MMGPKHRPRRKRETDRLSTVWFVENMVVNGEGEDDDGAKGIKMLLAKDTARSMAMAVVVKTVFFHNGQLLGLLGSRNTVTFSSVVMALP